MAKKSAKQVGWGMQPANVQYHPPVRSAGSRIQPPPAPLSTAARVRRIENRVGLLEELRSAQARIRELEAELERNRPPF